MKLPLQLSAILGALLLSIGATQAADDLGLGPNPVSPVLVSEVDAIRPGEAFWVGLWIEHPKNYHTYWKAPGIVGVPTDLDWKLPDSFSAGKIQWPVPKRVDMAGYNAHGYHGKTLLMVEITPSEKIDAEKVELAAKASWMCCSKTCHPGFQEVSISIPVDKKAETARLSKKWHPIFEETRTKFPKPLIGWKVTAEETAQWLTLSISPDKATEDVKPNPKAATIYFYSGDNHVNSASPQAVSRKPDGTIVLTMVRSPYGDTEAKNYPGLLYCEEGWLEDSDVRYGEVSIPRKDPKPFPVQVR